jgi:hypothetical protein
MVAPRWAMINRPLAYETLDVKREGSKANNWWEALFSPPTKRNKGGEKEDE